MKELFVKLQMDNADGVVSNLGHEVLSCLIVMRDIIAIPLDIIAISDPCRNLSRTILLRIEQTITFTRIVLFGSRDSTSIMRCRVLGLPVPPVGGNDDIYLRISDAPILNSVQLIAQEYRDFIKDLNAIIPELRQCYQKVSTEWSTIEIVEVQQKMLEEIISIGVEGILFKRFSVDGDAN